MKKTTTLILLLAMTLGVGCRRHRIIPDKVLGQIFHDALLTNSYIDQHLAVLDSTNVYEPIFERYGYTTEDVRYTIANFARRKSARLSDVAEHMILLLDREARELNRQVVILDTIDNAARRFATRTLLSDTMVRASVAADSAKLRFRLDDLPGEGDYRITARYTLDSLDRTAGRRLRVEWVLPDSSRRMATGGVVQRTRGSEFTQTLTVGADDRFAGMEIDFAHFGVIEGRRPLTRMTVERVEVTYTPPTERCVEQLFNSQAGLRIFSDSMINFIERRARETAAR